MATSALDSSRRYSEEEYFALDAASDARLEYFDGRIVPHPDDVVRDTPQAMAGATKAHNRVIGNLRRNLENMLIAAGSPCEVFAEEIRVTVADPGRYTHPDLVVTCDDRDDDPLTVQRPAVVVEVLSVSTERYDRTGKFELYRAIPWLDQIILIEPRWPAIDSYTRNPDGRTWTLTALRALTEDLVLRTVDVRIPLAAIYHRIQLSQRRSWEEA